jgi:ferritin
MPTPYLDQISKEKGIPMADLERYWDEAKKQRATDQKKSVAKFSDSDWAYVTGVVQKRAGVKESVLREDLSDQMNFEFSSGYLYWAMAAWCNIQGYDNLEKFFNEAGDEEFEHANKIETYLLDRGYFLEYDPSQGQVINPGKWQSLYEVFSEALDHERMVTESIKSLFEEARIMGDYQTEKFLHWFLEEQIDEEVKFETLLKLLEASGNDEYAINLDIENLLGE